MKIFKKLISTLLSACIVASCAATGSLAASAAPVDSDHPELAQDTVQGGAILHCFDWSYNAIKANLADIKAAGYTAIQTSPVQPPKDYSASYTESSSNWWKLYQPLDLCVAESGSWLGTKDELSKMCEAADSYGIKVIVDIVSNHLANNGSVGTGKFTNYLHEDVNSELKKDEYFFDNVGGVSSYSRYQMTHGHLGMPELNTANADIQQRVLAFLKECVDCGVDGFRFDTAKHIELPTDDEQTRSDFWPTVINGINAYQEGLYIYGEILGDACSKDINRQYTQYMDLTDDVTGYFARSAVKNQDCSALSDSYYQKGIQADQAVLWAESHDTYMNDDGNSKNDTNDTIVKTWAMVNSRADSTSLFFVRPDEYSMGAAGTDTTWKSAPVAETNKLKNLFEGQSEYLSYDTAGKAACNERGTKGAVIVKVNGGGEVNLTAHKLKDGSYTDHVSNTTFNVTNGVISGTVGSSGVAVLYNEGDTEEDYITVSKLYLKPNISSWTAGSSQHYAMYVFNRKTNAWVTMTQSGTAGVYEAAVPEGKWTGVIFCLMNGTGNSWDNKSLQTIDLFPDEGTDLFTVTAKDASDTKKYTGTWSVYTAAPTTVPPSTVQPSTALPADTYTVYAANKNKWSTMNVYYWGGSNSIDWPGEPMQQGTAVFTAEIPNDVTGIIFNTGSNGTYQTVNITTGIADNAQFVINTTTDGQGHYTVEQGPSYYLVGSMNQWTEDDNYLLSLSPSADGKVQYVLNGVQLTAGDTLKVKDSKNGWFPSGGESANYTVTATGTYNLTFRPNADGDSTWHKNTLYLENVTPCNVTWIDGDGNSLATDTVLYGETPAYTGDTPTKTADEQYSYTFEGDWLPVPAALTGDAVYTAQFTPVPHNWSVSWTWDGTDSAYADFTCSECEKTASRPATVSAAEFDDRTEYTATVDFNNSTYTDTKTVFKRPTFTGHSLYLQGRIGINFYFDAHQYDISDTTVTFTYKGQSIAATPTLKSGTVYYVTFYVPAKEMGDSIEATITCGEQTTSSTYAVKNYLYRIIKNEEGEAGTEKPEQLQALAKSMLHYGAMAQKEFNYNTDNLVDSELGDYTPTAVDESALTTFDYSETPFADYGLTYVGSTMLLRDTTTYRLYFTAADAETAANTVVKLDGEVLTPNILDNYIRYDLSGIPAAELGETKTLTFTNGGNTMTVSFNTGNYIAGAVKKTNNEELVNVITALYDYNAKAIAYFRA